MSAASGARVLVRDADVEDLPGVLQIYNEIIAHSTAVYSDTAVTLADRLQWWRARTAQGYPVLVAGEPADILGFATFGDFRSWPGYRYTVEHTVHVRHDCRARGIGRELMQVLLGRAAACGKHMMIAGIDATNDASIRFHERLGFTRAAVLHEVGYKFDRWLDLLFMQRALP
jgi:phosphinothricin acetyltransferase